MILKIEIGQNNPILRKKSLEIKKINSDIQKLVNDMIETMNKNNGVGLAANQIGKNIRIFVIAKEVSPACPLRSEASQRGRKKQVFINPEIIKISNKTEKSEEGCLSLPNVFLKIKRAKSLKIKTIDEYGKKFKLKAKGLLAHVIQHELDHLNGVLILDKNENS